MSVTAPNFTLEGRVALVTGAGSGIGAGVAQGLAASGAAVGCVDLNRAGLEKTVSDIGAAGGEAQAVVADVVDEQSMTAAVAQVEDRFGPLTTAVNCAGVHDTAPAESMSRQQWQRVIDVNLTGVLVSCQAEARAMMAAEGGAIVNIGSISGHISNRGLDQIHYNAAKAAVIHLSKSLALEWCEHGIRVNVVSPGYTLTPLSRAAEGEAQTRDYRDDIPLGRLARVREMAGPTVFLLSDAASYCTGTDLVVDGGATLW